MEQPQKTHESSTDTQKLEWLEPTFESFSSDIIQSGFEFSSTEVAFVSGPDS